jgi:hypothetical protein
MNIVYRGQLVEATVLGDPCDHPFYGRITLCSVYERNHTDGTSLSIVAVDAAGLTHRLMGYNKI